MGHVTCEILSYIFFTMDVFGYNSTNLGNSRCLILWSRNKFGLRTIFSHFSHHCYPSSVTALNSRGCRSVNMNLAHSEFLACIRLPSFCAAIIWLKSVFVPYFVMSSWIWSLMGRAYWLWCISTAIFLWEPLNIKSRPWNHWKAQIYVHMFTCKHKPWLAHSVGSLHCLCNQH